MAKPNPKDLRTKTGKRGGARANAGRKPDAVKQAKRAAQVSRADAARKSFDFLISVIDDPIADLREKVKAAIYIIDAVEGKPVPRETPELNVNLKHSADATYWENLRKVYGPIAERLGYTGAPGAAGTTD